jgi:hypothetical protein
MARLVSLACVYLMLTVDEHGGLPDCAKYAGRRVVESGLKTQAAVGSPLVPAYRIVAIFEEDYCLPEGLTRCDFLTQAARVGAATALVPLTPLTPRV